MPNRSTLKQRCGECRGGSGIKNRTEQHLTSMYLRTQKDIPGVRSPFRFSPEGTYRNSVMVHRTSEVRYIQEIFRLGRPSAVRVRSLTHCSSHALVLRVPSASIPAAAFCCVIAA